MIGSSLAHPIPDLKQGKPRTSAIFGLVLHTTGSGIVEQARKHQADPLEWAVAYYAKPDSYSAHYVVGFDGWCVQITSEDRIALHVGVSAADRADYLSGAWRKKVSTSTAALWDATWPFTSPSHLYPGTSVNAVYIGCELLPLDDVALKEGYTPHLPGMSFTSQQHEIARGLCVDIAKRHQAPISMKNRYLGHEDVSPLTRQDKGGGWDPGALRGKPRFDWGYVLK